MREHIEERAVLLANYIVENKATVRSTAAKFSVSKSTVHKDITERLKYINKGLCRKIGEVLSLNKSERHIRGGLATRKKYKGLS